jgi:hypothetical protein
MDQQDPLILGALEQLLVRILQLIAMAILDGIRRVRNRVAADFPPELVAVTALLTPVMWITILLPGKKVSGLRHLAEELQSVP